MGDLNRILQQWAMALGGAERLAQVQTLSKRGQNESFGAPAELLIQAAADGHYTNGLNSSLGRSQLAVLAPNAGWIKAGGKVTAMGEMHRAIFTSLAYLETFSALVPGRMAGQVRFVKEEEHAWVVEVAPEQGIPMLVYLDQESGLPQCYLIDFGEARLRWQWADWRELDGVKCAFRMVETEEPGGAPIETVFEEVLLNPAETRGWFEQPVDDPLPYHFAEGLTSVTIPIEVTSNKIYFPLQVNGEDVPAFLFDTGSGGGVMIDEELALEQGLELSGETAVGGAGAGQARLSFAAGVSVALPGLEFEPRVAEVLPLNQVIGPVEGRRVGGLWGGQMFQYFVVEIDYVGKQLTFHDPAHYEYQGAGTVIPLALTFFHPFVEANIQWPGREAVAGNFLVDTGVRTALDFTVPFLQRNGFEPPADKAPVTVGCGIGGEVKGYYMQLGLGLGGLEFPEVLSTLPAAAEGAEASAVFDGIIGGVLLRRFKVIFDYPQSRMILEPAEKDWNRPTEHDVSGLFLRALPSHYDRIEVLDVAAESKAAQAGVQKGDELLTINEKAVDKLGLEQVRQLFCVAGRTFRVQLRRGESRTEVVLTL